MPSYPTHVARSHAICMVSVSAKNVSDLTVRTGKLFLVDLAGSEMVGKSGATDQRLDEAKHINKSLSALSDVFVALGNKSMKVKPYRNSTLTYLLQPCFEGDGKTLMMLNLSPAPASYQESLCSLRFGSKVNTVDMGHRGRGV